MTQPFIQYIWDLLVECYHPLRPESLKISPHIRHISQIRWDIDCILHNLFKIVKL